MLYTNIDVPEEIREFLCLVEQDHSIDELKRKAGEFSFVPQSAVSAFELYQERFDTSIDEILYKGLFFVFCCLFIRLKSGDVCLKVTKEDLSPIFTQDLVSELDFSDDTALYNQYQKTVDELLFKICTKLENSLFKSDNFLASTSTDALTPLVVYKAEGITRVYLRSFFGYENYIKNFFLERSFDSSFLSADDIEYFRSALDSLFADESIKDGELNYQKIAAATAMASNFSVICGGPGTGKTTTVVKLLFLLLAKDKEPKRIRLCAPTGKAAAKMMESILEQLNSSADDKYSFRAKAQKFCDDRNLDFSEIIKGIPHESTTVHKTLGYYPHSAVPKYNQDNYLPCDILVVDEISMIPLYMFCNLLKAVDSKTKVIMLGDKDQLNSVEPGRVLGDICSVLDGDAPLSDSRAEIISKLTGYSKESLKMKVEGMGSALSDTVSLLVKSRRFSKDSVLGKVAKAVNTAKTQKDASDLMTSGSIRDIGDDVKNCFDKCEVGFFDVTGMSKQKLSKASDEIAEEIASIYCGKNGYFEYLKQSEYVITEDNSEELFKKLNTSRVICSNLEGALGVHELNKKIERKVRHNLKSFFEKNRDKNSYISSDMEFFPGRVILITKNNRLLGVDNGDVGVCCISDKNLRPVVVFPSKNGNRHDLIKISPERLSDYESGFAMTIHKSQGSEYDNVIMMLSDRDNPILTKELIYTGLTRAKERHLKVNGEDLKSGGKVLIIGNKEIFKKAIIRKVQRASGLSLMLNDSK
ncbi:MAG: exodeoxyribonuclease V subunit alpha [Succinivibrio sp.]